MISPNLADNVTPDRAGWFRQRCSHCGEAGHNARACPERLRRSCAVCRGTARLPCSQCCGLGFVSKAGGGGNGGGSSSSSSGGGGGSSKTAFGSSAVSVSANRMDVGAHKKKVFWLSPEQKKMADAARSRARFFGLVEEGKDELIGGQSVEQVHHGAGAQTRGVEERCARCLGRGYLSCMACSTE